MNEHRKHPRIRTLKAGKIIFNQRFSVMDCTIRNISDGGACLQVGGVAGIPDHFDLLFEQEKVSKPCCIAWKSDTRIGVAFEQLVEAVYNYKSPVNWRHDLRAK